MFGPNGIDPFELRALFSKNSKTQNGQWTASFANECRRFFQRQILSVFLSPILLFLLILSFGSLLLLLSLKMNSNIERQTKILCELIEQRQKHKSGTIIVLSSDKEFTEILSAALKTKMENMPKATQILDEKKQMDDSKRRKNGKNVPQIGGAISEDWGNAAKTCPLAEEFSHNSTNEKNGNQQAPAAFSSNYGIAFWRFVHFQKGATVSLATVLLLFIVVVIISQHSTANILRIGATIKENGKNYGERVPPNESCDNWWQSDEKKEKPNETISLEASVWWHYFSRPTNAQQPSENCADDESVVPATPPKASILKKRKRFESVELQQNANDSLPLNTFRLVSARPNKDVHFVVKAELSEQTNDSMGSRLSPKGNNRINENSRIFILRHPPDKNCMGVEAQQFEESLEEQMARRIAAENGRQCYSNRGRGDGYRKKAAANKWLRLLNSIENRRRQTNEATPLKTFSAKNEKSTKWDHLFGAF